jgi:fluoride ion exporter CrcB/FEX
VGVNAIGALMLGIVTSAKFPKDLVPVFVTAFRIVSAIVTVDAYNIYLAGKKDLALFYFMCAVPLNLLMNHLGRTIGNEVL